jgi:SAM-dependent methyltransferase
LGPTPLATGEIDYEAVAARVRSALERPGSGAMWRALEPVAEVIAGVAGVGRGMRVLDVAAGDGNLARACAARGAEVTTCDLDQADQLAFAEGEFDAATSCFGAALQPRPSLVARELCQVVRPGGVVALCAWVPRGLPGRLHELADQIDPLPQGVPSPADWGRQAIARERLAGLLDELELRTRTVRLRFADADAAFDALAVWAPLDDSQLHELRPGFDRLLASQNNSGTQVEIDARYLIASGRRPLGASQPGAGAHGWQAPG